MSGKLNDMHHKAVPVEIKGAQDEGTFTALVSVFNNVDLVGDRILPGAFEKTLETWRASGDPIPIILSHLHDDVMAHIGQADPKNVVETDKGLLVKDAQLDINDNPVAAQTFKLLKQRRLKEFSFGYTVPSGGQKVGKDGVNDVSQVGLIEAGPTLKGANPSTELQAVKAMAADPATHLTSMMAMAQQFIDTEPEAADVAAMRVVMDHLRALGATESGEDTSTRSAEIEDPKDEEPTVAKSRRQEPLSQIRRDLMLTRLGR